MSVLFTLRRCSALVGLTAALALMQPASPGHADPADIDGFALSAPNASLNVVTDHPATATPIIFYTVDASLNRVSQVLKTSSGTAVKTFVSGQGEDTGLQWTVSWDGTSDSGTPQPSGLYSLVISGYDASGTSHTATVPIQLIRGVPLTISPVSGTTVTGTAQFTLTRNAAFPDPIDGQLQVSCQYGTPATVNPASTPKAASYTLSVDTTLCPDGAVGTANVQYIYSDAFGNRTFYYSPLSYSFSVTNPLKLQRYNVASSVIGPGRGYWYGQWQVNHAASWTETITPKGSSSVVRTIESNVPDPNHTLIDGSAHDVTWDGKNDAGTMVPDGTYVMHTTVTDSAGGNRTDSIEIGVDSTVPGTLTGPTSLKGVVTLTFTRTPGFPDPLSGEISISCGGPYDGPSFTDTPHAASWSRTADTAACSTGPFTANASYHFADKYGVDHYWGSNAYTGTVDNPWASGQLSRSPLTSARTATTRTTAGRASSTRHAPRRSSARSLPRDRRRSCARSQP